MYKYFNNSPNGNKVGDCVIRAISAATGTPWGEVYIELCLQGYLMGDLPSSNAVWHKYLTTKGWTREFVSNDCPVCYTVEDFSREHPDGVYIIGTGTHATVVIDGDIFDTWDCSGEQPIYFYYKQEERK